MQVAYTGPLPVHPDGVGRYTPRAGLEKLAMEKSDTREQRAQQHGGGTSRDDVLLSQPTGRKAIPAWNTARMVTIQNVLAQATAVGLSLIVSSEARSSIRRR